MIYNMDLIPSPGLIEEMIQYHRQGNFDRVMGFMQLMFSVEENYEQSVDKEPYVNPNIKYLVDNMDKMFKR